MALDATPGGASANSYITRADADTYFGSRFGTAAWDALGNSDKEKALQQATRELDRVLFHGVKWTSTQALQFPRDVQEQAVDEIPPEVQHACCEQALWIAQNQTTGGQSRRQQLQAEGVESFRTGQASETFGRSGPSALCPQATQFLARWIRRGARIVSERETTAPARVVWPFS